MWKQGPTEGEGITHAIVYDVPQSPLVSVGQFQHAQLSRYQYEPGFVVGNSYANLRIPLGQTVLNNFAGLADFKMVDTSYEINRRLWDEYFFSTMSPDYLGIAGDPGGTYDSKLSFARLSAGSQQLPNPRMLFRPRSEDVDFATVITSAGDKAPQAIASRIVVSGAFNVNSTSVDAWKAFLSGMGASELPSTDPKSGAVSWEKPDGVRFNRFGQSISTQKFTGNSYEAAFWQGWRSLAGTLLTELAKAIVDEVRERTVARDRIPFLSMADFVNRDPAATQPAHQRKGALQAALDKAVNGALEDQIGKKASTPEGAFFQTAAVNDENEAAGHASYLLQGDVLQSLSPLMQVRSDYFRIRSYGEAKNRDGEVVARAWCEAFVQRTPEYTNPADSPEVANTDLKNGQNKTFGRRFSLVSFRWLSQDGI